MVTLTGADLRIVRDGLMRLFSEERDFADASNDVDLFGDYKYSALAPVTGNYQQRLSSVLSVVNDRGQIHIIVDFWEHHAKGQASHLEEIRKIREKLSTGGHDPKPDPDGKPAPSSKRPIFWCIGGFLTALLGLASADISGYIDLHHKSYGLQLILGFTIICISLGVAAQIHKRPVQDFLEWDLRTIPFIGVVSVSIFGLSLYSANSFWSTVSSIYRQFALQLLQTIPPSNDVIPYNKNNAKVRIHYAEGYERTYTLNLLEQIRRNLYLHGRNEPKILNDGRFFYNFPKTDFLEFIICAEHVNKKWFLRQFSLAPSDPLSKVTININGDGQHVESCKELFDSQRSFISLRNSQPVLIQFATETYIQLETVQQVSELAIAREQFDPPWPKHIDMLFSSRNRLDQLLPGTDAERPLPSPDDLKLIHLRKLQNGPLGWPAAPLVVQHKAFRLGYDPTKRRPIFAGQVVFEGMPNIVACPDRTTNEHWRPDEHVPLPTQPQITDFRGSGFVRGQLVRRCDARLNGIDAVADAYLLSATVPQHPDNNRKGWLAIENYTTEASRKRPILVLAGPIYPALHLGDEFALTIGENRVPVPRELYRVLIAYGADDKLEVQAFVSKNTDSPGSQSADEWLTSQRTSLFEVDRLLGYQLLPMVSNDLRTSVNTDDWR
jgi:DNA/RNA endonuclease G (NUC1)